MIEATTNPAARSIMQNAHAERAAAVQGVWAWLMGRVFPLSDCSVLTG